MVKYVLSKKVPRLNVLAIVALRYDVGSLITFAESTGVPQLGHCFAELDDLVNALLHPDLPQFGDNMSMMNTLFPRLDPIKLSRVLEKLIPTPTTVTDRSLPRLDKRMIAVLVKQLSRASY
jgi:hypothetical protein